MLVTHARLALVLVLVLALATTVPLGPVVRAADHGRRGGISESRRGGISESRFKLDDFFGPNYAPKLNPTEMNEKHTALVLAVHEAWLANENAGKEFDEAKKEAAAKELSRLRALLTAVDTHCEWGVKTEKRETILAPGGSSTRAEWEACFKKCCDELQVWKQFHKGYGPYAVREPGDPENQPYIAAERAFLRCAARCGPKS